MKRAGLVVSAVLTGIVCGQGCVGDSPEGAALQSDSGASSSGTGGGSSGGDGGGSSSGDASSPFDPDAADADVCALATPGTLVALESFPFDGSFRDIAALPGGAEVLVGSVSGSTLVGDAGITPTDANGSALVIKRNADGSAAWQRAFGGAESDSFSAVTTDAAGDVYVAGTFFSPTFSLDDQLTVTGDTSRPGVVAKLSGQDGHVMWARSYVSGAYNEGCHGIAWNADRLSIGCSLGANQDYVALDGNVQTLHGRFYSLAVYGLDPASGRARWARAFDTGSTEQPPNTGIYFGTVELNAEGQTLVAGYHNGTYLGDPDAIVSAPKVGDYDNGFVLVISKTGVPDWVKGFGVTNGTQYANVFSTLATFVPGGVVVASSFTNGSLNLGDGPHASAGGFDVVVAKLANQAGAPAWSKYLGGADSDEAVGLTADACGRPIVALRARSEIVVDGTALPVPQQSSNVLITAKLDPATGALLWAHGARPGSNADTSSLQAGTLNDVHGRTVLVGDFRGTANFGSGFDILESASGSNPLLARFGF